METYSILYEDIHYIMKTYTIVPVPFYCFYYVLLFILLSLRLLMTRFKLGISYLFVLENVTDNEDVAARAPKDGARSQKPQTFKVGFSYKF